MVAGGPQDWAATPLGPVESWPQSLKTAAGMVLGSNVPMFVAWGPDLLLIYNDGYAEILGDRGPRLGPAGAGDLGRHLGRGSGPMPSGRCAGETLFFEAEPRTAAARRARGAGLADLRLQSDPRRGAARSAGIFGTVTAVGRDAAAEDRLRESEERFRLIADSAPVPMWVTKLDRKRSFVNRAYVDFLGITYEEAVDYRLAHTSSIPTTQPRILAESIAGEASLETLRARRRASAAATANGAGCARSRSRAGGPAASISASSASPTTSPSGSEADGDARRRGSRSAPPTCAPRSTGSRPRSASASAPRRRCARRRRWRRSAS